MLRVENVMITNFKPSLRGMRNPLNSWHKSDTYYESPRNVDIRGTRRRTPVFKTFDVTDNRGVVTEQIKYDPIMLYYNCFDDERNFVESDSGIPLIGPDDLRLCKQLIDGGSVHSKFERFITVTMDITASFDFWKEYDTYKISTNSNGCSTMHTIALHEITIDNFSLADLREKDIEQMKLHIEYMNTHVLNDDSLSTLEKTRILSKINFLGYEQRRTVQFSYRTLSEMIRWRKNHKLDEWRRFVSEYLSKLPYVESFYYTRSNG